VSIPIIEQAKIQAQVLVPLVRALQTELGEARANALVRRALAEPYRRMGQRWREAKATGNVGDDMASAFTSFAKAGALDYSVRAKTQDTCEIDVTGCRYAEFYKEIGEPELGFLLVCSSDFAFGEGIDPGTTLARSQTIMQGASHCEFRYQRKTT
jgi:hypothetical protein